MLIIISEMFLGILSLIWKLLLLLLCLVRSCRLELMYISLSKRITSSLLAHRNDIYQYTEQNYLPGPTKASFRKANKANSCWKKFFEAPKLVDIAKSAIPPLFNDPKVLPSEFDEAKLVTDTCSENSFLDDSSGSLSTFPSKTNLKL